MVTLLTVAAVVTVVCVIAGIFFYALADCIAGLAEMLKVFEWIRKQILILVKKFSGNNPEN